MPVLGHDGTVLGTFAIYRRTTGGFPRGGMRDGRELQGLDPRGHRADRARRELTRLATRDTVIWLLNRGAFLASAQEVFTRRPSTTYRRAVEAVASLQGTV